MNLQQAGMNRIDPSEHSSCKKTPDDRLQSLIEADNNTDQTAAHTESLLPAPGRQQKKNQQHEERMRDLNYQLKQLRHRNRDGSYATQADRAGFLQFVADQLHEAGFRDLHATGLKPKHVEALCQRWQAAFGLRRAESIKIQPAWADRGNALVLRASWCKGGRERSIPMRTCL